MDAVSPGMSRLQLLSRSPLPKVRSSAGAGCPLTVQVPASRPGSTGSAPSFRTDNRRRVSPRSPMVGRGSVASSHQETPRASGAFSVTITRVSARALPCS